MQGPTIFLFFSERKGNEDGGGHEAGVACAQLCRWLDCYWWACGPCSWALTCSETIAVSSYSLSELSELESS